MCIYNTWTSLLPPTYLRYIISYSRFGDEGRRGALRDPHPAGKSWQPKLWISTQAITGWLSTHHIISPNHSKWKFTLISSQPHLPSATSNCLVSHPRALLIGLILLIELHLRNMWESGAASSPRLHSSSQSFTLCPITTIKTSAITNAWEIGAQPQGGNWWKVWSEFKHASLSLSLSLSLSHSEMWLVKTCSTVIAPGNHINTPDRLPGWIKEQGGLSADHQR